MTRRVRSQPNIRVLVVGPRPDSSGGIGRLMKVMEEQARTSCGTVCKFIDPGATGRARSALFAWALLRIFMLGMTRRVDVLHVNLASRGSALRKMAVGLVSGLARTPYILHLHGAEFDAYFASSHRLIRALLRSLFGHAAAVVVLGDGWRRFVISELKVPERQVFVVPNCATGPDEPVARTSKDDARILFSGRLGDRKGVYVLLRALADIPSEGSRWSAAICGDGEVERVRLEAERIGGSIDVPGWLDPFRLNRELAAADVFVLPSRAEGLPLSMLQAMAWGHAIVTTPVGAIPEVLENGDSALFVPPDDAEALTIALSRLIEDPTLRRRLGSAARKRWEEGFAPHSWWQSISSVQCRAVDLR